MVAVKKYSDFTTPKEQTESSKERDKKVYFSCFPILKIEKKDSGLTFLHYPSYKNCSIDNVIQERNNLNSYYD